MKCNFDLGHTCMLEQDIDDDFDWDVSKHGSEVAGTGPSGDRTLSEGNLGVLFMHYNFPATTANFERKLLQEPICNVYEPL